VDGEESDEPGAVLRVAGEQHAAAAGDIQQAARPAMATGAGEGEGGGEAVGHDEAGAVTNVKTRQHLVIAEP